MVNLDGCWADVFVDHSDRIRQCGATVSPESDLGLCQSCLTKKRKNKDK